MVNEEFTFLKKKQTTLKINYLLNRKIKTK